MPKLQQVPPDETISQPEMEAALLRSGYLLETRLESALWLSGYSAFANEAYPDPYTGKARELDLHALRVEASGSLLKDALLFHLVIECFNNPQPIAFFSKPQGEPLLAARTVKYAGIPISILAADDDVTFTSLGTVLSIGNFHHYVTDTISTQYCSFTKKGKGGGQESAWMASHQERDEESFRKLCSVVDYLMEKQFSTANVGTHTDDIRTRDGGSMEGDGANVPYTLSFYYPLVVVQGGLVEINQTGTSLSVCNVNHVQYLRTNIADDENRVYQIDVVTEEYFPSYLALVRREQDEILKGVHQHERRIRRTLGPISYKARWAGNAERRAQILRLGQ